MTLRKVALMAPVIIVALLAAACGGPALSELSGRVVDSAGQGITGAVVRLGDDESTTGSGGSFTFTDVEAGVYEFEAQATGKVPHVSTVAVGDRATTVEVVLEDVPLPPGCEPKANDPEGMRLVYCESFQQGESPTDLGWHIGSGHWTIAQAEGKRWIEGTSEGGQRWAYIAIPEMAGAEKIVIEYTATYVSAGNTWSLQFPADDPEQAHGTTFMLLSAWDGVYFRRYHENNAIVESTIISPPKLMTGEVVTMRITYDYRNKQVDMERNGVRPPEYPRTIADSYLIKGPDNHLLKLYVNVGGAAGETTARWTDIKVWVENE